MYNKLLIDERIILMRKLFLLFTLCGCLFLSVPVHAQDITQEIGCQVTTEYVISQVTTLETIYHLDNTRASAYITTSKEITYTGIITPAASISWTETIDGTKYSGTLYRQSFYHNSDKTIAIYKGTLYPVS